MQLLILNLQKFITSVKEDSFYTLPTLGIAEEHPLLKFQTNFLSNFTFWQSVSLYKLS